MPQFEVSARRDEDIWEKIEAEKALHPEYFCRYPPEFRVEGTVTTAIQTYQIDESKVVEEIVEPTTCEARKLLGGICGRDLPCRYHK